MLRLLALILVLVALMGALVQSPQVRARLKGPVADLKHALFVARLGASRQSILLPMPDGVRLATDIYLPRGADLPLPVVLIRLPYGKTRFGEVRHALSLLLPQGYAMVVQDMRGRHRSEGVFAPYPDDRADSAATLDWIAAQDWSTGRVGMVGCSALGETQLLAAATRSPVLRAIVPVGAGGAAGTLGGTHGFFGFFEGGVFTLASGFGWFAGAGEKTPDAQRPAAIDYAAGLATLPVRDAVAAVRPDPTDYEALLDGFDDPAFWRDSGFLGDADRFDAPFLILDGWYDGARESLRIAQAMRDSGAPGTVVILPGLHCDLTGAFASGAVGDRPVAPEAGRDIDALISGHLAHALKDAPAPDLPPVLAYVLGADRWLEAATWPPAEARPVTFHLDAGTLAPDPPATPGTATFTADPLDPVPSSGGAICCTGDPDLRAGPLDQRPIEGRRDLLLYTSAPLEAPLTLAGPIEAELTVTLDQPDADLVLRLTEVFPDGRSITVQEGALRLRYRDGFDAPRLLTPGTPVRVTVPLRDIAAEIPAGHRLRLHVAASSFPRLARNLHSGKDPARETEADARPVTITLREGPSQGGVLRLWALP